jgi:sn-2 palmitoyl-lipid 9-desaturase
MIMFSTKLIKQIVDFSHLNQINISQIDWKIAIFISVTHLIAFTQAIPCFSWSAIGLGTLLYWLTGSLGISLCFHRLLSHHSFRVPQGLGYILALLGTLAMQGGPIKWVAHHRLHHAYADTERDPHSAQRGFWWSHVLWIVCQKHSDIFQYETYSKYAPELARDPIYRFLDRRFAALQVLLALVLYAIGGWSFVVYGVFIRIVILWHATWLINSATHLWGTHPFDIKDNARNLWWLNIIVIGDGWHHNHHAYPHFAKFGLEWWQIDCTYGVIWLLEKLKLATHINVLSPSTLIDQNATVK